jgi:hypothetical protein
MGEHEWCLVIAASCVVLTGSFAVGVVRGRPHFVAYAAPNEVTQCNIIMYIINVLVRRGRLLESDSRSIL